METLAIPQEEIPLPESLGVHRAGRILVAEDDVHMRRLISAMIRNAGYRVVEAGDGAEVLERIESTIWHDRHDVFKVIVSDLNMPALTGMDLLAALRCADLDTPFILLTAFGDDAVRAEAKWLGATAVLDKPFDAAELQRAIRLAFRGSHAWWTTPRPAGVGARPARARRRPH